MRRKDKLILDQGVLDKVIKEGQICRVALVNEDKPYIIPMSYGYDGLHIYLHSALQGQKVNIIEKNPHVCLEFEDRVQILEAEKPCNWGVRYISVILHGRAEKIVEAQAKNYGLAQVVNQYQPETKEIQFTPEELASVIVYKIHPDEFIGKISGMSLEDYLK